MSFLSLRWSPFLWLILVLVLSGHHHHHHHVHGFFLPESSRLLAPSGGRIAFSPFLSSSSPSNLGLAKGFGASTGKKQQQQQQQPPSEKQILKQLKQNYGGTSPQEIAMGTQRRIDMALQKQPPHIQLALQIYQQLQPWKYQLSTMSLLDQAQIPVEQMEGAQRAQNELDRLMKEHVFTSRDLHNIIQQATWDASADAKAARSITGAMPSDIQRKVQKACEVAVERALTMDPKAKVLDVGCGFGVLVPFLKQAGLSDNQIHGVDLSAEMIRNAQQWYPDCHWKAGDFYTLPMDGMYQSIIFCSSLHDLPDPMDALRKARDSLCPGGTLVIVHPQGASHVLNQVRNNPTMVPRGLPTTTELETLVGWKVIRPPAASKSPDELKEGYLAVLERIE